MSLGQVGVSPDEVHESFALSQKGKMGDRRLSVVFSGPHIIAA